MTARAADKLYLALQKGKRVERRLRTANPVVVKHMRFTRHWLPLANYTLQPFR